MTNWYKLAYYLVWAQKRFVSNRWFQTRAIYFVFQGLDAISDGKEINWVIRLHLGFRTSEGELTNASKTKFGQG